jgi:hypothetical protein
MVSVRVRWRRLRRDTGNLGRARRAQRQMARANPTTRNGW